MVAAKSEPGRLGRETPPFECVTVTLEGVVLILPGDTEGALDGR